jgi:ribosome-associated protein
MEAHLSTSNPSESAVNTEAAHREHTLAIARDIMTGLEDKKAEDILLLDLYPSAATGEYAIADYFIIATGNSDRQLRALIDSVRETVKILHERNPIVVEGDHSSGWVLMDYGAIIVHIMTEQQRHYYDLETLYKQANVVVRIQ